MKLTNNIENHFIFKYLKLKMFKNRPNQVTGVERSKQIMAQEELIELKKKEFEMKIRIKSIGINEEDQSK